MELREEIGVKSSYLSDPDGLAEVRLARLAELALAALGNVKRNHVIACDAS